jgi:hypothetical protein
MPYANQADSKDYYQRNKDRIKARAAARRVPFAQWPEEKKRAMADYKRLARIRGAAGYKPTAHDAHVNAWKQWKKEQQSQRQLRLHRQRIELHDAHVRLWRSDSSRIARWKVKHDAGYCLNMRMRVAIRKALHGNKAGRAWESIVGYTLAELRGHFERMLPKGKTLDEVMKEGWHIDHIVPKSTYNLADESELAKAWCMSNLRLMPAHENCSKGNKRTFLL